MILLTKFKYVVDTSVIMRRSQYEAYDIGSFPHQWKNFDEKVEEGLLVSTPLVYNEIENNNKELIPWADEHIKMFEKIDENVIDEAKFLSKKFKEWYNNPKNKYIPWADPQLIAFAKAHNIVLVTQEAWNNEPKTKEINYKIPTICSKIGAYCHIGSEQSTIVDINTPFQCIDFVELIKREKLYI